MAVYLLYATTGASHFAGGNARVNFSPKPRSGAPLDAFGQVAGTQVGKATVAMVTRAIILMSMAWIIKGATR
jgi:hypothetical protein